MTSQHQQRTVTGDDEVTNVLESIKSTVPCEDSAPVNDIDETQLMDFDDGETEVLHFSGDTQVMDFDGETQLLDDDDDDYKQNMETQLLESDNEDAGDGDDDGAGGDGSDRTEVLSDTEGFNDLKSNEVVGHGPHGDQKVVSSSPSLKVQPASAVGEPRSSGLISTHAASLRASGLALHSMVSKWTDGNYCSNVKACQSSGDKVSALAIVGKGTEFSETCDEMCGLQNENETRVGSKTARKLFSGEEDTDDNNSNADIGEDLPQVHGYDNDLAGLSYVDSQEPGEASQANALECVERFLKGNLLGLDHDVNHGSIITENVNPASGVKGPQSLAKKVSLRNKLEEARIFDWDDSREDEGGGDFFNKNKEALFGACLKGRKSCTEPRKPKQNSGKQCRSFVKIRDEEESVRNRIMGLVNSEGKSVLNNSQKIDKVEELNTQRNRMHELDHEQSCPDSSGKQAEGAKLDFTTPDIPEVGPDTQMAAEAMEALSMFGLHNDGVQNSHPAEQICKGRLERAALRRRESKEGSLHKTVCVSDLGVVTRSRRTTLTCTRLQEDSKSYVASRTRSRSLPKEVDADALKESTKRIISDMENDPNLNRIGPSGKRLLKRNDKKREEGPDGQPSLQIKRKRSDKRLLKGNGKKKQDALGGIPDGMDTVEPIAQRTRKCSAVNHLEAVGDASKELRDVPKLRKLQADGVSTKRNIGVGDASEDSKAKQKKQKSSRVVIGASLGASNSMGSSLQNVSDLVNEGDKSGDQPAVSLRHDPVELCITRRKRSKGNSKRVKLAHDRNHSFPATPPSVEHNGAISLSNNIDACYKASAEGAEVHLMSDRSPAVVRKSVSLATTPPSCRIPAIEASPICVGNNYCTPSSSLAKELDRLTPVYKYSSPYKDLRKKRDISSIRVLFSHHLDDDVIKQQKKILGRLGVPQASSILDATHFVTDKFVRTRNMLEAIASGKPVVTPSWIESCGLACCFIDEKNYILRDTKKEKELRFSMPVSLVRASQHPLLQGWRVLVTPNVKPSKDIILSLVKAVHGQAMERTCRSVLSDDKFPDDLLVLSCEEDYEVCVPLLEKGVAVHSSELLLQGIITQKLDHERHRLFLDHVKRTRSTVWLRKDRDQFLAVKKRK